MLLLLIIDIFHGYANFTVMIKKIVLLFFFIGNIYNGYMQTHSIILRTNDFASDIGCIKLVTTFYISLLPDDTYHIYMIENTPDITDMWYRIHDKIDISHGNYIIRNSFLYLTDSYTEAEWVFQWHREENYLTPVKGADFLADTMILQADTLQHEVDTSIQINQTPIQYKMENSVSGQYDTTFATGYFIQWGDPYCFLRLTDNEFTVFYTVRLLMYTLYLDNMTGALVLASGTWQRKGNVLELHSTSFEHTFYALIKPDKQLQLLMFGDKMIDGKSQEMFYRVK